MTRPAGEQNERRDRGSAADTAGRSGSPPTRRMSGVEWSSKDLGELIRSPDTLKSAVTVMRSTGWTRCGHGKATLYSFKVLGGHLLRNEDGANITSGIIEAIARVGPQAEPSIEIRSPPAFVMQDFAGISSSSSTWPPCVGGRRPGRRPGQGGTHWRRLTW